MKKIIKKVIRLDDPQNQEPTRRSNYNVGDILVGNDRAVRYLRTRCSVIVEVIGITRPFNYLVQRDDTLLIYTNILVKIIGYPDNYEEYRFIGQEYEVSSMAFDLVQSNFKSNFKSPKETTNAKIGNGKTITIINI
mgnify:CR=1 FL=1